METEYIVCGLVSEIIHLCINDRVLLQCCCGALCVISVLGRVDLHLKSASREGLDRRLCSVRRLLVRLSVYFVDFHLSSLVSLVPRTLSGFPKACR